MGEIIYYGQLKKRKDLIGSRLLCINSNLPKVYPMGAITLVGTWYNGATGMTEPSVFGHYTGCSAMWQVLDGEELQIEDFV